MILLLDTSTAVCRAWLVFDGQTHTYEWPAGRALARDLHAWLRDRLGEHQASWGSLSGIGVLRGPGSFTGLRIGITTLNTLAAALRVPIVGTIGEDWRDQALQRLQAGQDDRLVIPTYGAEAHITTPKK